MEVTNGEIQVDLPDALAQLLINNKEWDKAGKRKRSAATVTAPVEPTAPADDGDDDVADCNTQSKPDDDEPIPMTHIPGVVPGVSMKKVQALVKSGTVPVTVKDRKKLVRPSDVIAALK